MKSSKIRKRQSCPLESLQAKELMSPNPVSIRRDATIREALELLTDQGFGAAPVIDDAGRPVGVLSRTDVLIHEREYVRHASTSDRFPESSWPEEGFFIEVADPTAVGEIMTPAVFTVSLETPAREVVRRMLELKVHQLFVIDADLALVGVISPLDVLRHLEK